MREAAAGGGYGRLLAHTDGLRGLYPGPHPLAHRLPAHARRAAATATYPARDWCGHPRTVEGWCPLDVALAALGADPATLRVRGQGQVARELAALGVADRGDLAGLVRSFALAWDYRYPGDLRAALDVGDCDA
jgi:hypothetical protein